MVIDIPIACIPDTDTGRSELNVLLEALLEYRENVEQRQKQFGTANPGELRQLNSITQSIQDATVKALEEQATKEFRGQ